MQPARFGAGNHAVLDGIAEIGRPTDGVRHLRVDDVVRGAELAVGARAGEVYGDTGNARVAGILDAVVVLVAEDRVAFQIYYPLDSLHNDPYN